MQIEIQTIQDGSVPYANPTHIKSSWEAKKRLEKLLSVEALKKIFKYVE